MTSPDPSASDQTPGTDSIPKRGADWSGAVSSPDSVQPEPPQEFREDIYGNDVNPAVGEYRVDDLGEMYEEHAPDTALLKLSPPNT